MVAVVHEAPLVTKPNMVTLIALLDRNGYGSGIAAKERAVARIVCNQRVRTAGQKSCAPIDFPGCYR